MSESSWEETRKAQQKKIHRLVIVFIPLLLLVTVVIINNSDQITRDNQSQQHIQKEVTTNKLQIISDPPKKKEREKETVPQPPEMTTTPAAEKSIPLPQKEKIVQKKPEIEQIPEKVRVKMAENVPKTVDKTSSFSRSAPVQRVHSVLSEVLPPINCSLLNRKDIVISLSLELFFMDEDHRAAIRISREEIKVMVMKSVFDKELSQIKIATLEKLLLQNVNSIFDHDYIKDLKIKNIQVEKADQ